MMIKLVLLTLTHLTTSPWVVISESNQGPTWLAPSTEVRLPVHHHHCLHHHHGHYCHHHHLHPMTIATYQWQMKGSRGSSLVHRPVILSGSQAEGVKKKEALEKVIDKLSRLRVCS